MPLGLGLSEGLGSALLSRPNLEPAVLLAGRLLLKGWQKPGCMSACDADPLNFCSRALATARSGDA